MRYPSNSLYDELKVLDIRQLFTKTVLIFLINNKKYLNELIHKYETRAITAAHLTLPRTHQTVGQRSITFIVLRLCNNIP